mgnify:CR=1 FL=1
MENYGMDDIRTCYNNCSENSWVENQFDTGILYYNYRGWWGSSSIDQNGLNSGIYAPFSVTVTCGTGDFNGTSDSEDFFREGSESSPKGAVACVGVSTTGTHTLYNNIVHMGIYEGIFSKGMYHAGAAMGMGRLALLRTYPTNPSNAVSRFSNWPNLIGDPALHLWTGKPHDFIIDAPASVPESTTSLDVGVMDENGNFVENARVTLILGDEYFTEYTDESGNATLTWDGDFSSHGSIAVFKNDFRLAQQSLAIGQVQGPALFLDDTRTAINDFEYGNGNSMLNPGEQVLIEIPILNYGDTSVQDLVIELRSQNDKVIISDPIQNYDLIAPNSEASFIYSISLDNSLYEAEELNLILEISDSNHNEWSISVPTYVYAPKLELIDYYISGSGILSQGEESKIDLTFKNKGSINLENVLINFSDDENLISFPSNELIIEQIDANDEFV